MSFLMDQIHQKHVDKFNPIVAQGVAVSQMRNALEYIDNAIKLSAISFPPELQYEGYKICTVQEEINFLLQRRTNKHTIELAPSDVYMVNFYFKWGDEPLPPKPIYIPYLGKGGIVTLRGKRFTANPVLADETISVAKEGIFVPFLAAKVTFKRMQYWFRMDGQQHTEYLIYSKIHNHNPSKQPRRSTRADLSVNCTSTIPHYLFCKFGVAYTFKHFFDTDIYITDGVVDRNLYPEDKYVVCSSSQIRPRSVKNKFYVPSNIKVVLPRDKLNNGTRGLLSGLFYVLDHYPERFTQDSLDGTIDEIRLWRVHLGHVVFRNKNSEGELLNDINDHFDSLDKYVDDMTRDGLASMGYIVNDLYDLMVLLVFDYTEIVMKTEPASMYNKMLLVNRYVLADMVKGVSLFKYKIASIRNKQLTYNDINKWLNKYLKPEVIFNRLNNHNEIVSTQCAGDNIMFQYTSRVILQENATGNTKRKTATSFNDPSKLLHPSIAVAGSILALPKAEPTGRTVLSPYLTLDHTHRIKEPASLKPVLNYITNRITYHK